LRELRVSLANVVARRLPDRALRRLTADAGAVPSPAPPATPRGVTPRPHPPTGSCVPRGRCCGPVAPVADAAVFSCAAASALRRTQAARSPRCSSTNVARAGSRRREAAREQALLRDAEGPHGGRTVVTLAAGSASGVSLPALAPGRARTRGATGVVLALGGHHAGQSELSGAGTLRVLKASGCRQRR